MVKHIILWKLKETLSDDEKANIKGEIKVSLEGLVGQIKGLLSMNIRVECMESSSADMMMESAFESGEALKAYQKHPKHEKIAETLVRPNVATRLSMDYYEE